MLGRTKAQEHQRTPRPPETGLSLLRMFGEVLHSAHSTIVSHPRDWSLEKRDAWLYGIIVGWGDDPKCDAISEIVADHGFDAATVERMKRLQALVHRAETAFLEMRRQRQDPEILEDADIYAYEEGQWWIQELDAILSVPHGEKMEISDDLRRAVLIVHDLLRIVQAAKQGDYAGVKPPQPPADQA